MGFPDDLRGVHTHLCRVRLMNTKRLNLVEAAAQEPSSIVYFSPAALGRYRRLLLIRRGFEGHYQAAQTIKGVNNERIRGLFCGRPFVPEAPSAMKRGSTLLDLPLAGVPM